MRYVCNTRSGTNDMLKDAVFSPEVEECNLGCVVVCMERLRMMNMHPIIQAAGYAMIM